MAASKSASKKTSAKKPTKKVRKAARRGSRFCTRHARAKSGHQMRAFFFLCRQKALRHAVFPAAVLTLPPLRAPCHTGRLQEEDAV
jgi:hypothetical protein